MTERTQSVPVVEQCFLRISNSVLFKLDKIKQMFCWNSLIFILTQWALISALVQNLLSEKPVALHICKKTIVPLLHNIKLLDIVFYGGTFWQGQIYVDLTSTFLKIGMFISSKLGLGKLFR